MRASGICCPLRAETVRLQTPAALRREEVYRYMGCPQDDPTASRLLDVCEPALLAAVQPRGVWRMLSRSEIPAGLRLDTGDAARHLEGCDRILLMAVTLGPGVEPSCAAIPPPMWRWLRLQTQPGACWQSRWPMGWSAACATGLPGRGCI